MFLQPSPSKLHSIQRQQENLDPLKFQAPTSDFNRMKSVGHNDNLYRRPYDHKLQYNMDTMNPFVEQNVSRLIKCGLLHPQNKSEQRYTNPAEPKGRKTRNKRRVTSLTLEPASLPAKRQNVSTPQPMEMQLPQMSQVYLSPSEKIREGMFINL